MRILDDIAALSDVPWRTLVLSLRVDGVWRSLDVKAVCPENEESEM